MKPGAPVLSREGPVRCRGEAAGVRAGGRPSARTRRTRPAPDAQIHGRPVDGVHHDQVVNEKPERQVLMMWRHRFITDSWAWELPMGLVEEGETPEEAAAP